MHCQRPPRLGTPDPEHRIAAARCKVVFVVRVRCHRSQLERSGRVLLQARDVEGFLALLRLGCGRAGTDQPWRVAHRKQLDGGDIGLRHLVAVVDLEVGRDLARDLHVGGRRRLVVHAPDVGPDVLGRDLENLVAARPDKEAERPVVVAAALDAQAVDAQRLDGCERCELVRGLAHVDAADFHRLQVVVPDPDHAVPPAREDEVAGLAFMLVHARVLDGAETEDRALGSVLQHGVQHTLLPHVDHAVLGPGQRKTWREGDVENVAEG
eukprot:1285657-Rhodomonas_salina.5